MVNIASLLKSSAVRRYPSGTVVLREGDASKGEMYFLLQGTAAAFQDYKGEREAQADTYGPGGFFGETVLFLGKGTPVTVVAQEDLLALAINKQNAAEVFSTQPEMTLGILEGLCRKLDALSTVHRDLLAKIEGGAVTFVQQDTSRSSSLFPEGHGTYLLPIDNQNSEYLVEQKYTCPVCAKEFSSMFVIASRLRRDRSDDDLRVYYKDFEPLYYDVITCPHCFYSALTEQFPQGSKRWADRIAEEAAPFRKELAVKTGIYRDTFTVFAGYYLALRFAPICLDDYQLTQANLWVKLSRLYQDCKDENMYLYACRKALEAYKYSYEHFRISERQMQQICYIIGNLYMKLDDLDTARTFHFMAKSNKAGTAVMERMADNKLDEIREMLKARKEQGK